MHSTLHVMEADGGRNQSNPLAWLEIVYSGAIDASDNHTLSSKKVETPTDTFCAIWNANSGRTSPYQQRPPSQDHLPKSRESRVASMEVVRTLFQPHIKSAWPSPDPDLNSGLQVLEKGRFKKIQQHLKPTSQAASFTRQYLFKLTKF